MNDESFGDITSLAIALHRGGVHGDGGWVGPIAVVLLLMVLISVVYRSRCP